MSSTTLLASWLGKALRTGALAPGLRPGEQVRAWLTRTAELQRELAAIAEVDPSWWLLAGAAALAEPRAAPAKVYLACDAEPDADTFMGYPSPPPRDLIRDAIARARAARTALRELDGTLPEQPLAVTVERAAGAKPRPSTLSVAAFAIADRCLTADLEDPDLGHKLAATLAGAASGVVLVPTAVLVMLPVVAVI